MKRGMASGELSGAAVAANPKVNATQQKLLEARYDLKPHLDPLAKMSRGKPLAVGPTARLPKGMDWQGLAALGPAGIRQKNLFPYKARPHPAQGGGLCGPRFSLSQMQRS